MNKKAIDVFFELLRAGLWADVESKDLRKHEFPESVAWENVYQLASEQSVQGLVLQGIESSKIQDPRFKIPQELLLQWIGEVQIIEQQNKAMNGFVAKLIEKLREADVYAILVKGQGIAQCYERPLWRASGDVDLFLSEDNYEKAKAFLSPMASSIDEERTATKHIALDIDSCEVELHGTLRSELWGAVDNVLDEIKEEVFYCGTVSSWKNNQTPIFILGPDENVTFVFSHILQHFFRGGIGLRQICDWCRLLWTYKDSLNRGLLESRIRKMGLMTEWKAFGAFVVEYLGMPVDAMPLYSDDEKWKRKSGKILSYILETGNFGHNRDVSYQSKYPAFTRKLITFTRQAKDSLQIMRIFPFDAVKSLCSFWRCGIRTAVREK